MGKSKNKKPDQVSETAQSPDPEAVAVDPSNSVRAIDGQNTQGWSDKEVKSYNDLVHERQKLERRKQELTEKYAKSQTQRALLHESVADIDNVFKPQNSGLSPYIYTGQNECCVEVEPVAMCDHEVCKRAKTKGISDQELDTIKYYSLRIHTEKSERMQSALRKQRDLELTRVKKDEDDGQVKNARKASSKTNSSFEGTTKASDHHGMSKDVTKAAKETEKIINKVIHQLDILRSDLQTGRISAEEAQGKLNILDTKLPAIQDKVHDNSNAPDRLEGGEMSADKLQATAKYFQKHLRERLLNAKGDTFSQAFSIMDHFLSATKPDDLQVAISELKDVLQLSGPICSELQNSFGALEGIFDTPDKLSFSGPDGKQECTSMIDLMDKLKETLKRTGQLPEGANASLTKTFQECIDLEVKAKDEMTTKCSDGTTASGEMLDALIKIKNEFVAKSPIPPLTSNKLDIDITNLLDVYDVRQLLAKAATETKSTVLEAQITSLVISRTQKKSDKFVEKLQRFDIACNTAGHQEGSEMLREAIANVMVKMKKFVPNPEVKKNQQPKPVDESSSNPVSNQKITKSKQVEAATKTSGIGSSRSTPSLPSAGISPDSREALIASIQREGSFGVWDIFHAQRGKKSFSSDDSLLDKVNDYKGGVLAMIEDQGYGVKATICSLFKLKLCPGVVATIVAQALFEVAKTSEDDCRLYMRDLSTFIKGDLPHPITPEWSRSFQHIALAMTQTYVATTVESMAALPKLSPLCVALSTVATLTTFVLMSKSAEASVDNLKQMGHYLLDCFDPYKSTRPSLIGHLLNNYHHFCVNNKFRCPTAGPCTKHMNFTSMPHKPRVMVSTSSRLDAVPKIKPTKTKVCYPPGHQHQNQEHDFRQTKSRHRTIAQYHQRAAELYRLTAYRAAAIAQLQSDNYEHRQVLPPNELLDAMDDLSKFTVDDYNLTAQVLQRSKMVNNNSVSKFSEHLNDSQLSALMTVGNAFRLRHTFAQLKNGTLGEQYLDSVVQNIVERALSGRYGNPVNGINTYVYSLATTIEMPKLVHDALTKAQGLVKNVFENSQSRYAYTTMQLKGILSVVGSHKPSISSLLELAINHPPGFEAYHRIVIAQFQRTDIEKATVLEVAFSKIADSARNSQLDETTPPMIAYFELAMEDWNLRPEHLTRADSSPNRRDIDNLEEVDGSDNLVVQHNETPRLMASPARLPVLQEQSHATATYVEEAPETGNVNVDGSADIDTDTDTSIDRPQYLLSSNQGGSADGEIGQDSDNASTPYMFRMIDMTKHLTALQRNTKEMLDGAQQMMKYNMEQGRQMEKVAQTMASQVTEWTHFVGQIGEWNGAEVVQEVLGPGPRRR